MGWTCTRFSRKSVFWTNFSIFYHFSPYNFYKMVRISLSSSSAIILLSKMALLLISSFRLINISFKNVKIGVQNESIFHAKWHLFASHSFFLIFVQVQPEVLQSGYLANTFWMNCILWNNHWWGSNSPQFCAGLGAQVLDNPVLCWFSDVPLIDKYYQKQQ